MSRVVSIGDVNDTAPYLDVEDGLRSEQLRRPLLPISAAAFLRIEFQPREYILEPIIPERGTAMLFAWRGLGKTWVALSIAHAVASGGKFLRWTAPRSRRVLYVDGEMPREIIQERLKAIIAGADERIGEDALQLLVSDMFDEGFPDLSTESGQKRIDLALNGVNLVILDNLSTLCRSGKENEAESWRSVQDWLLALRRRGISVLIVHHANKSGDQRGSSKRQDILDTAIRLEKPQDHSQEDGARFEVHFDKARGFAGDAAKPFEATLEIRDGKAIWRCQDIEDANLKRIVELTQEGMSVREIAEETGIPKSTVNRLQKKAREVGMCI